MLTVDLSYIAFIILRYIPSSPTLSRDFIMKACWILSGLFCSCCVDNVFSFFLISLSPFTWFIMYIDLHMLNHHRISGIKSSWSWWVIFSIYACIWHRSILMRFLHPYLLVILACNFLFCCVFTCFMSYSNTGFIEEG